MFHISAIMRDEVQSHPESSFRNFRQRRSHTGHDIENLSMEISNIVVRYCIKHMGLLSFEEGTIK